MKLLLVGGGGREHALAWRLRHENPKLEIIAAPGNPGIAELAKCVETESTSIDALVELARHEGVDWTLVGPEAPLALGIVDAFRAARKRDQPFDVVVTDLGMPRLDGRQLTQILKSESPLTPILMMTGWGTLIKGEDLPAQVDGMLNKPPNIGELLEALRKVTQSRA